MSQAKTFLPLMCLDRLIKMIGMNKCYLQRIVYSLQLQSKLRSRAHYEKQYWTLSLMSHWSFVLHLFQILLDLDFWDYNFAISLVDHQLMVDCSLPKAFLGRAFQYQPSFVGLNWQRSI